MTDPADLAHLRDAAREGVCPLCGVGGWASVAMHTARAHGVGARELKARLGLPLSHPLTSPAVQTRQSEIRAELGTPPALIESGRTSSRATSIGPAGVAARRADAVRAGQVKGARHGKLAGVDLADADRRVRSGERLSDVGAELGVTASGLHRALRVWRDGRR